MLFLAILVPSTAIVWLLGRHTGGMRDYARRGLAAAMVIAGVTHFTNADPFVQHMPDWVPARELIVYISGALEIALGIAMLLWREHRGSIGRLLAMYLVAVFPANVYVAIADVDVTGQPGGLCVDLAAPSGPVRDMGALEHDQRGRCRRCIRDTTAPLECGEHSNQPLTEGAVMHAVITLSKTHSRASGVNDDRGDRIRWRAHVGDRPWPPARHRFPSNVLPSRPRTCGRARHPRVGSSDLA